MGTQKLVRGKSWDLLACFKLNTDKGWCVVGDFNKIVSQSEN